MSALGRAARGAFSNLIWLVPAYWAAPEFFRQDRLTWIYLGVVIFATTVGAVLVDPVSIDNRSGTDKRSEVWLSICLWAGLVLSPLDAAQAWLALPPVARWFGLGFLVVGFGLRMAAVATNRFFSGTLLVQAERGHHVVNRGPYAVIRHPGYAALLLVLPGHALAWGSGLGLVPLCLGVLVVLRRTILEDNFLSTHLPGYSEYRHKVRYRWIPGVF